MTAEPQAPEMDTTSAADGDDEDGGGLRLHVSLEEKIDIARTTAQQIFELLGAGVPQIEVGVEEDQIVVRLQNVSPLLQPAGDTRVLESTQFILNKAVNKLALKRTRLSLDAEGFRRRRPEGLDKVAAELVRKALQLGKAISVGPIGQGDLRFLTHQIGRSAGVVAQAVGPQERRKLLIAPEQPVDGAVEGEEADDTGDAAGSAGNRRRRRRRR